MKILALDIATNTGFAYTGLDGQVELGTWELGTAAEIRRWGIQRLTRRNDPRVFRLYSHLTADFLKNVDIVVFEDVQFQSYTQQCQLWSGLRSAVWLAFDSPTIIEAVPVKTLKQFATGHGGATKGMMMAAAARLSNGRITVEEVDVKGEVKSLFDTLRNRSLDDNAADALHLWNWAHRNLARTVVK